MLRITQNMLTSQFLYNITQINQTMQQDQQQLATGKSLNLPQDNPLAVSQDMSIKDALSQNTAYLSTISAGLTWMNNTSGAVQQLSNALTNIQQAVISAINTPNQSQGGVNGFYQTVQQYVSGIAQILNTTQGTRYLFNGTNTSTPPATITAGTLSVAATTSTTNTINYQFASNLNSSTNVTASINISANDLMLTTSTGASQNLVTTLNQIVTDLKTNSTSSLNDLSTQLKNLQAGMSNVINLNASLGATIQRATALQNQMTQYGTTMTNQKSTLEDANMAQVITQFTTDQTVYQSALKMGSEVLLPSLVSFLPNG
nr:flagellin [Bacilli bacterium]